MVSRVQANEQQETGLPRFGLGYGFCFGQSEAKAMSMSMLDRVLSAARGRSTWRGRSSCQ